VKYDNIVFHKKVLIVDVVAKKVKYSTYLRYTAVVIFNSESKKQRAYAMLLLCYGGVSLKPVIGKYLLEEGWTPLSLYVLLLLMAVIILGVHELASLHHKKSWQLSRQDWRGIAISTVTGGIICPLLTFSALSMATATHTVLIGSISPLFVVLLAVFLLGERLKRHAVEGMLLLLLGLGILLYKDILTLTIDQATIFLLLSALIGPFSMISHKKYVEHRHLDSIVLIKSIISLVLVGGWMLWREPESVKIFVADQNIWLVLALSIVSFIFPYLLFYAALKNIKAFEAGIISLFSPVFTIILANTILGETLQPHELISLVVMLAGISLINVPLTKWRIVPSRLLMMGPFRR